MTARLAEAFREAVLARMHPAEAAEVLLPVVRKLMAEERKAEREAVLAYLARYTRDVLPYDDIARGVHRG